RVGYHQRRLKRAVAFAEKDLDAPFATGATEPSGRDDGCRDDVGFAIVVKVRYGDIVGDAEKRVLKSLVERAVAHSRENAQLVGGLNHQVREAIAIEIGRHLAIVVGVAGGQSADDGDGRPY